MGVEGPKEREKGKKESFMRSFLVVLKKKKKVQVHITSDFRDRKRRRMGNNEVRAAVRNEMARRDGQV